MQNLSDLIAAYLEMCEHERKLSQDTVKAYRIDLKQFLQFVDGVTIDTELLNRYVKHLNQNYAPRSVKRKLASLRAFFNELELCEAIRENPFGKLHVRLQMPRQLPRIIPERLVRNILQSAYDAYAPERREVLRDMVAYVNDDEKILRVNYILQNSDGTDWFVDVSQAEIKDVLVNGNQAEVFIAEAKDSANALAWTTNDAAFYVTGFLSEAELVAVAESIQEIS